MIDTEETALILSPQSLFPKTMPMEEQKLLSCYPLEVIEQAIRIFSLDDTIDERHLTLADEAYHELKREQAEMVDEVLCTLGRTLQGTIIMLSYYMVKIGNSRLAEYIHTDIETWLKEKGIEPSIIKVAMSYYRVWPYLHSIGLTVEEVFTENFIAEKVKFIARLDTEQYTQIKESYERKRKERYGDIPPSQEQDAALRQEVKAAYNVRAQAAARHILSTPLDALEAKDRQEKNQGEQPKIYLTGTWRDGCFYYDPGVLPLNYAELMFLTHGPVQVVGFNGKNARAYAEKMLEQVLPPDPDSLYTL